MLVVLLEVFAATVFELGATPVTLDLGVFKPPADPNGVFVVVTSEAAAVVLVFLSLDKAWPISCAMGLSLLSSKTP